MNPLAEDMHQAVNYLSQELYSKDVHFLMELIQPKGSEIQASEIKYAENYMEAVNKRKGKDPSRLLKEKGVSKKPKIDKKSTDDSNKHDQFFRADIDRDILHFYKENVAERTRDTIVLNILDHQVSESNYVECFKEKGYMNSSIMFLQCALWNEEWKEKAIDKVIFSYNAMLQLSGLKKGLSTLAAELLTGDHELKVNLIFVPIVHESHWFLIVISCENTIYILASFFSKSRDPLICRILTTMEQLLGPGYISEVLEVLLEQNNYDCGFRVLLCINGFDDKKPEQICGVNKDMVEKSRIETSVHLRRCCHKLNKPDEPIIVNDDDDVEVLENRFSYDNCRFNTVVRGEGENLELSTPSFMDRIETFVDEKEINVDGKKTGNARTGKNGKETKNARAESNVDKKTGLAQGRYNRKRK
ncbi:hypothetical protein ACP4OV_009056 [Aristida adscensionis]